MFRLLIFFPVFLLSQEFFLLPDESKYFFDTLNAKIKKANSKIYLFSPYIDEYTLVNALKQSAKKELQITIITGQPLHKNNKTAQLALYKNISIFTLNPLRHGSENSQGLHGSFGCIDNKELFLLTTDLHSEKTRSDYAFALYKDKACEAIFHTLLRRAKAY